MNSIQYNMLENAVNQLYKDEKIIKRLVYYINRLVEGDDCIESLTEDMHKFGFWDEDGFPVDDEDDD